MMDRLKVFFVAVFLPVSVYAMADRRASVYGVPTLYGEYEVTSDDVKRMASQYGNVPVSYPSPIRIGTQKNQPGAKHPVKTKKVAPKKKSTKKKLPAKQAVAQAKVVDIAPIVTEKIDTPIIVQDNASVAEKTPVVAVVPSPLAENIAQHAADKIDIDSFCEQIRPQGQGNLPDGIILMPGRPDLMSCVSHNKN